jgi:hypothetical protein
MILMPKKNLTTFTMYCVVQGSMAIAECVNERLNPLKAEPENKAKREDLSEFSSALLATMKRDRPDNGETQSSVFGPAEKGALIVCFAWLGMPEKCEEVLEFTQLPILGYLWEDLRAPIRQSGSIMRYRHFLTKALSNTNDLEQVCDGLIALVGPPGEIEHSPDELAWCQQMIQTALSSYPPHKRVSQSEISSLMSIYGSFGWNMYAEWYVTRLAPRLNISSNLVPQCVALRDRARCANLALRAVRVGLDGSRRIRGLCRIRYIGVAERRPSDRQSPG